MTQSLIRASFHALFMTGLSLFVFSAALVAQEGSGDPFGEVVESKKAPLKKTDAKSKEATDAGKVVDETRDGRSENPFKTVVEPEKTESNGGKAVDPKTAAAKSGVGNTGVDGNAANPANANSGKSNAGTGQLGGGSGPPDSDRQPRNDARTDASRTGETSAKNPAGTFETKFWEYLQSNAYQNWAPVPGQSGDFAESESPHGALVKLYLNRTAAGNPKSLPIGSIVVKENYRSDRQTLESLTVMYRSKGYNPEQGDWYWVKFNPDGTVAKPPSSAKNKMLKGRVQSCIECHAGAKGKDFIFFNDR